jgi:hypothetical protein
MVSSTGCLKLCEKGPVVLVYPQGYWYHGGGGRRRHRRHPGRSGKRRPGQGIFGGLSPQSRR